MISFVKKETNGLFVVRFKKRSAHNDHKQWKLATVPEVTKLGDGIQKVYKYI
jgi:hypothetical protein